MDRLLRARHGLPLGVLAFFMVLDLVRPPGQVVLGLVVIAPLVAASTVGRRATAAYAALALLAAVLLGVYDRQYQPDVVAAQGIRLFGVALGGAIALVVCTLRQRRELLVRRLSVEAATSRSAVQMAEALQRSLLTDPPRVAGLELVARYVPAVQHARVGGDWYDAFATSDDSTMLVIGDVAGHDVAAAATMAQTRGVLRGIASAVVGSPAAVLSSLDRALRRLQVDTLVTVTVATLRSDLRDGTVRLCWSNAGHPPPVLVSADGDASVLQHPANLLLGVAADVPRTDHALRLEPGDTVVLYTDGLVERRSSTLDEGTAWLVRELTALAGRPLEQVCDTLLAHLPGTFEDDVAILAVRVGDGA
ncbi:Serine phosphatase RsbU, regulator of sigma subunit [Modestobacter sp. DSM 44400]|uniref:PP2C family protein-serine/threonine phosphatase n=1 Tax=Modestobacter sp. DSM 44400 TaxID=1550230 RepID=UPI000899A5F1|nr:PP2C family protein-serine/threonine phosphatase [Modestobacter sp. DSM 44400]SDY55220.1 Serine phosphatase RsbU, regulator of sigma subunit [Modestobacter sp. DSM 44400]